MKFEVAQRQITVYQDSTGNLRPDHSFLRWIAVKNFADSFVISTGQNGQCISRFQNIHTFLNRLEGIFFTFSVCTVAACGGDKILNALHCKYKAQYCCNQKMFHFKVFSSSNPF